MKSVRMKPTGGIVAILLAAALAGAVWIHSERHKSGISQQPDSSATPALDSDLGRQGGASSLNQSAGQYKGGAAGVAMNVDQINQKLAQNEQDLTLAQDRLQRAQGDLQTADLDQQIDQQQQTIMDLQARSKAGSSQDASTQLQNQAILTEQNFQILQQRITGVQQQIQNQQGISNEIEQRLRNTSAPDTSDLMVNLNNQLQTSEQHKRLLQSEYDSLVQQQQQLASTRYSNQAQQQQQQQAGAVSTDLALEQARARLDNLNRQKQQLINEVDQDKRRVDELQSERSSLLNQAQ